MLNGRRWEENRMHLKTALSEIWSASELLMSLKCQASQDASVLKGYQNTQTLNLMSEMTQKKLYLSIYGIPRLSWAGACFVKHGLSVRMYGYWNKWFSQAASPSRCLSSPFPAPSIIAARHVSSDYLFQLRTY